MASKRKRKRKSTKQQHRNRKSPNYRKRLIQARKLCKYSNYASIGVIIWIWVKPVPFFLAMTTAFALPIIGLILAARFSGIIEINGEEESKAPNVLYSILLPPMAAAIRLGSEYNLAEYLPTWIMAVVLAVAALAFAIYKVQELSLHQSQGIFTSVFFLLVFTVYWWSVLIFTNCHLDRSEAQVFSASVLSKEITEGSRSISFYISIDAWGPDESPEKVEIDEDFFDLVNQGDEVNVILREGTLGFPWYYVDY